MTEAEVKTFRALADAATEGPWGRRIDCELQHSYSVAYGTDGTVAQRLRRDNAEFVAAARNTAERLCDALLAAWAERAELEGYVHDFARDAVPAAMLAEAQGRGREEACREIWEQAPGQYGDYERWRKYRIRNLPPLPAESPTARELRERAAMLEAENARLREVLKLISCGVHLAGYSSWQRDTKEQIRQALEGEGVGDG